MASYYDEMLNRYKVEDPINKLVYEITSFIKNRRDFNGAINLILSNNLKLQDVVSRTARLTLDDVVKLADLLILKNRFCKLGKGKMESIIYELRANDIKEEDIDYIMKRVKNRISEENIDSELQKLGYPKIFTVDYDDYDYSEYDDVYDEDYNNSHGYKQGYDDEL